MGGEADKKVSKLGRKGDARMHRAVAARLANPDLSLFEALQLGGFDFPADDDASLMDTEQVTLGQRKNQLSRRLRLARQQEKGSGHGGGGGGSRASSNGRASSRHETDSASTESRHHHRQLSNGSSRVAAAASSKRGASLLSDHHSSMASELEMYEEEEEKAKKMAKYHPQFHPMHIRSNRTTSPASAVAAAVAAAQHQQHQQQQQQQQQGASFHQAAAAAAALYSRSSFLGGASHNVHFHHAPPPAPPQPHPSGVAIQSLTNTAQSVGYTLEQLAVALASSSNLVRVLANPNTNRKQEMALNLFRSEVTALYSRCMLMAGYPPEEAVEGTSEHLQIALKAWEMESKRLSYLMERRHEFSNTAPLMPHVAMAAARRGRSPSAPSSVGRRSGRSSPAISETGAGSSSNSKELRRSREERQEMVVANNDDDDEVEEEEDVDDDEEEDRHHHQHRHGHEHHHDHHNHQHDDDDDDEDNGSVGSGSGKHNCFDGRHVHRLEGKCGHKAIIHLPKDGTAHIDFVVDNKVECYHGIAPIGMEKAVSLWPSQYKCEDLECPTPCGLKLCDHSQNCGQGSQSTAPANPRLLELSDLDFDGTEWNAENTGQIDETLMGLFQLGVETTSTTTTVADKSP